MATAVVKGPAKSLDASPLRRTLSLDPSPVVSVKSSGDSDRSLPQPPDYSHYNSKVTISHFDLLKVSSFKSYVEVTLMLSLDVLLDYKFFFYTNTEDDYKDCFHFYKTDGPYYNNNKFWKGLFFEALLFKSISSICRSWERAASAKLCW